MVARPKGATKPILAAGDEAPARAEALARRASRLSTQVMARLENDIVDSSVVAGVLSVAASLLCVLAMTRALTHTALILGCVLWVNCLLVSFCVKINH